MLRFCWLRAPLPIPHLATRAVILVRDQEVEGSNPFAPTTLFRINNLYHTRATRKCEERLARNQASLFHALGRKRSLFFEFIALQREVRFTDNSVFGKVGTGSGFWRKNQKAQSKSCVLPRCHSAPAFIASNHPRQELPLSFRASCGPICP
jgi:hypothetical protein